MTSDSKEGASKQAQNLIGRSSSSSFIRFSCSPPIFGLKYSLSQVLRKVPLTYIGSLTTPLSLVYIGIVLAKAGFQTIPLIKIQSSHWLVVLSLHLSSCSWF